MTTTRADSSFASESAFSHSEVGLDSAGIATTFQDIRPWRWPGFPYTGRAVAGCGEEVLAAYASTRSLRGSTQAVSPERRMESACSSRSVRR